MTVFEHIRKRLYDQAGITCWEEPLNHKDDYQTLVSTEWVPEFEKLMRNRLVLGAIRYETFCNKKKISELFGMYYDVMRYAKDKIEIYLTTGNLEGLVDAANLCMIEFNSPSHPLAHFDIIKPKENERAKIK